MAFKLLNNTWETTITTGTGNYTLAGAVSQFKSFGLQLATGDTTVLCVFNGTDEETGLYTYNSGSNSFARTTIYSSSNGGSAVAWPTGVKQIMCAATGANFQALLTPGSTGIPNRTGDTAWSFLSMTGTGSVVTTDSGTAAGPAFISSVTGTNSYAAASFSPTWNTSGNPIGLLLDATLTAVGNQDTTRVLSARINGSEVVGINAYGMFYMNNIGLFSPWASGLSVMPGGVNGADPNFFVGPPGVSGTFGAILRRGHVFAIGDPDTASRNNRVGIGWSADGILEINTGTLNTLGWTMSLGHYITATTAPATPAANTFVLYVDSADTKLKAKGPSGTVTILANP